MIQVRYCKQTLLFVWQLVQNSDDNRYEPGVTPTLHIEVHRDWLAFRNNEEGFTEDNVVALCNIGAGTKEAVAGYIGQKVIGFKSVFKVRPGQPAAPRPLPHLSLPFRLRGCSRRRLRLYHSDPPPAPARLGPPMVPHRGTTIVLPFQKKPADAEGGGDGDGGGGIFDLVRANVYDIESPLLLVLSRLRRIEVLDASEAVPHRRVMHRREESGGIVCIEDSAAAAGGGGPARLVLIP